MPYSTSGLLLLLPLPLPLPLLLLLHMVILSRFQQYLIFFVLLTTILCICVILPFNFQASIYLLRLQPKVFNLKFVG